MFQKIRVIPMILTLSAAAARRPLPQGSLSIRRRDRSRITRSSSSAIKKIISVGSQVSMPVIDLSQQWAMPGLVVRERTSPSPRICWSTSTRCARWTSSMKDGAVLRRPDARQKSTLSFNVAGECRERHFYPVQRTLRDRQPCMLHLTQRIIRRQLAKCCLVHSRNLAQEYCFCLRIVI